MKLQFGWMLSPRDVKYSSLHLVIGSIKLRLKGINDQTPNYIYINFFKFHGESQPPNIRYFGIEA